MKNLFKNLFLLVFILSFVSCNKNDEMTVYLKTSGRLTAQLVDNNGNILTNTNVKLYEYFNSGYGNSSVLLDEIKTNSKGRVDFGDLNARSYTLVVDTPKVNGIKYIPTKVVQVISASTKDININVQEYVGTVEWKIEMNNLAFAGLNVLVIPNNSYSSNDGLSVLKKKAEFVGVTDNSGHVSFTLPSNRYFSFIAYLNDTYTHLDSHNLDKGEVYKTTRSLSYYDFHRY